MKKIILLLFVLLFMVSCGQNDASDQVNGHMEEEQTKAQADSTLTNKSAQDVENAQEEPQPTMGLQAGQIPPSLALETLSGELFSEAEIEGKKVMINFWATWCGPCRVEMPDMVRLANEHKEDLVVLAVNVAEDEPEVKAFVKEFEMDFPVLLDRTGELTSQFQVLAIPTTYFLHSDGTIAVKHTGMLNYSQFVHAYQGLE
jgi:thiol-disulfide isomerase/thioredoxin